MIADRARGVLIGLAAGDRIGGPASMALELAESLAARHGFDRRDVLRRYVAWWTSRGFDTGPVAAEVFRLIASGTPANEAPRRAHDDLGGLTAGCNPAHRSVPLAMAAGLADDVLPEFAAEEAALTHRDPLAGDVAAATVVLCRALVRGTNWATALGQAAVGRGQRTQAALLSSQGTPLDVGGFAPEVLRAAIALVSRHTGFARALEAAVAFAGPANYCPVLAGAIAGARWGARDVPGEMLGHHDVGRLHRAADALARAWEEPRAS